MRSVFPSMTFSAEADKLLETLDMSKLVILNPEGDLERDSIAIFTYSEEIKKYVFLSYSEDMMAYKVFMLSDRMADDVDTAVRKQVALAQKRGLNSLTSSMIETKESSL